MKALATGAFLALLVALMAAVTADARAVSSERIATAWTLSTGDTGGGSGSSAIVGDGRRYLVYLERRGRSLAVRDTKQATTSHIRLPNKGAGCAPLDANDAEALVGCWGRRQEQRFALTIDLSNGQRQRVSVPRMERHGHFVEFLLDGLGEHWLTGRRCERGTIGPGGGPSCDYLYLSRDSGRVISPVSAFSFWDLDRRKIGPRKISAKLARKSERVRAYTRKAALVEPGGGGDLSLQTKQGRSTLLRPASSAPRQRRAIHFYPALGRDLDLSLRFAAWTDSAGGPARGVALDRPNRPFDFKGITGYGGLAITDFEVILAPNTRSGPSPLRAVPIERLP